MLLQNISARLGLVNGSVGVVTGFLHPLEMVELALRAPRQRYDRSERGEALLRRGGFASLDDVFRCVDTSYAQSLFWWLRQNFPRGRDREWGGGGLSYGEVYGSEHLLSVQRLVGLDEVASVDGETLLSLRDASETDGDAVLQNELQLLVPTTGRRRSGPHGAQLVLDQILPLHVQLMRLPVVRFDLQPPGQLLGTEKGDDNGAGGGCRHPPPCASQSMTTTKEENEEDDRKYADARTTASMSSPTVAGVGGGGGKTGSRGYRSHVYGYVSPYTQHWYMGQTVVASRTQLPLRHAWAMTVHKSQGLTISQLQVDMARFFSPGQAYVALSRATALENVKLYNFNPECIRACPVARGFYESLEAESSFLR